MLPGIRSLAAAMHLEIHRVYTRHLSSCFFVGCTHSPSHIVIYAPGDSLPCRCDAS
ncbi:hypothetical protein [Photorhabdus heterorhabditis]|uniref:hypothetical protein n=1 Tax=Photorhabdus heterorhabditis TaxID=880156 RepID=UPI001562803C|nr:hypothetical protein [Photorhabdus heterorhabditis]NRN26909.1 hypothetical protein [Photorhabdus heterorhabditis subsp. aluminescens]